VIGGVFAAPFGVEAQPAGKVWRIGRLRFGTTVPDPIPPEFVRQLEELGYVGGRNLVIEVSEHG